MTIISTIYSVSKFLHILSIIVWLWTIPVLMVINRVINRIEEKNLKNVLELTRLTSVFSTLGVIGLFFTGSLMTDLGNWGWFSFTTQPWLAIKQVIFFGFVLFGTIWMRRTNRIILQAQDKNSNMEYRDLMRKVIKQSHTISALIIVNIFLATTKLHFI